MPPNRELVVKVCECLLLEYERHNFRKRNKVIVTDDELADDCERVFHYVTGQYPVGLNNGAEMPIGDAVQLTALQRIQVNWTKQYGERAHERSREQRKQRAKWTKWKGNDDEGESSEQDGSGRGAGRAAEEEA